MVKDKEGKEGGGELESFLFGPEAKAEAEGNGRSIFSVQIVQKPQRPSASAARSPTPVSREAAGRRLGPACLVYLILTGSERERDS